MTERERLKNLILDANVQPPGESWSESIADYLIEHGVCCPPCKVGDTVYRICGAKKQRFVAPRIVEYITICRNGLIIGTDGATNILGKTVFLAREEAEAALTSRRGDTT